jgi:hypothetical protein
MIVVFLDANLCNVVDVSHISANPVAAMFMVKVNPIMKMKTAAQTESYHRTTHS